MIPKWENEWESFGQRGGCILERREWIREREKVAAYFLHIWIYAEMVHNPRRESTNSTQPIHNRIRSTSCNQRLRGFEDNNKRVPVPIPFCSVIISSSWAAQESSRVFGWSSRVPYFWDSSQHRSLFKFNSRKFVCALLWLVGKQDASYRRF